jgi:hypothetical protein
MAFRPSAGWHEGVEEERQELAAGTLDPEEAFMIELFPDSLIVSTDSALAAFEADLQVLQLHGAPTDDQVMAAVKSVVLALNAVNEAHDGAGYETGEREELCEYIDSSLIEAGVDVAALTARLGVKLYALTNEWRRW